MGRTNRTRFVALGALSLGPRTGYEVKRDIESSVGHFWSESPGQLYPILKALVAEGLATVADEPAGGRPRKVYSITPEGLDAFRTWLAEPPEPMKQRNELLLKVFFARQAGPEVAIEQITRALQEAVVGGRTLRAIKAEVEAEEDHPDRKYFLLTIDAGIELSESTQRWCKRSLEAVKRFEDERS